MSTMRNISNRTLFAVVIGTMIASPVIAAPWGDVQGERDVPMSVRGRPTCGNGVVEFGETCDPPEVGFCSETCHFVCGPLSGSCEFANGSPGCEDAECCEGVCAQDPYCCTTGWDAVCAASAAGVCLMPLDNDDCDTPQVVTDGLIDYYNYAATDDLADVWFSYTATCTGYATLSLCASDYDTVLEVYADAGCPIDVPVAENDEGCGSGLGSRVNLPVDMGDIITLRAGGYNGVTGEGWLSIACNASPGFAACGLGDESTAPCDAEHEPPGCENLTCCESVCAIDAYCCDIAWDLSCADLAASLCGF